MPPTRFIPPMGDVSRRSMIALAPGILGASTFAAPTPSLAAGRTKSHAAQATRELTFVLVHGAWHGGWCWKALAQRLRRQGYVVYTPTLTGLGERAHLARDETDLSTHIRDVVELLRYEDLQNVVLVGHSYSGFVITGVAARAADRLSGLVYLDAFVPADGVSFTDRAKITNLGALVRDGLVAPMLSLEQLGLRDPAIRQWASERIGGHPWRCFAEPLRYSAQAFSAVPLSYIRTSDLLPQEAAKAAEGFQMFDMRPAGHDAMLTDPDRLAEVLVTAAASAPRGVG